jgi:hypothetical protein
MGCRTRSKNMETARTSCKMAITIASMDVKLVIQMRTYVFYM